MVKRKIKILWLAGFLIIMNIAMISNNVPLYGAEPGTEMAAGDTASTEERSAGTESEGTTAVDAVPTEERSAGTDSEGIAVGDAAPSDDSTAEPDSTQTAPGDVVTELDLGAYQTRMTVGTTQLLTVTALPTSVTDCVFTFSSSDTGVAAINGLGRITAQKAGTTTITAACGSVTGSFLLTVEEEKTEKIILVTDVELAGYESELAVGKTLTLSATVVPSNATGAQLTFRSSDSSIATVTSTGEVKGIAKGNVIIYCSAGYVTKEVPITVKVETTKIEMNRRYLVLKPGNSFSLTATVTPSEAEQQVTYQSSKPEIAVVSPEGTVTAKACGSTSIIVSNGDSSIAVSVIVNQNGTKEQAAEEEETMETQSIVYPLQTSAAETPIVTRDMLKYYYEKKEILSVQGDGYLLKIDGNQIKNYANELVTGLEFQEETEGTSFILNEGKALCGVVTLSMEEVRGRYLYLYNESREKYEKIETASMSELTLTTAGKYLITEERITGPEWNRYVVWAAGAVIVILFAVYVGIKKKYWFW